MRDTSFKRNSSVVLVFVFAAMCTFMACSSDPQQFEIKGQFLNAGHVHALILYEGDRKLDSVFLTEKGNFKMSRAASHPRLFTLRAGTSHIPLILSNGDEVEIRMDLNDSTSNYVVEGSESSRALIEFSGLRLEKERAEEQIAAEFRNLTQNLEEEAILLLQDQYFARYRKFMEDYGRKVADYAKRQDDLVAFYAVNTLDPAFSENIWLDFAPRVQTGYEDNVLVRQFLDEVQNLRRLAIGQPAPDFQSLTPQNRPVQLSDFQGKVTLLDFWASWCVPCRQENPNLVRLYQKYKDLGFTIYGVSLDNNPGPWMKAIQDDGLVWTQASDLKAWGGEIVGLYRLKSIPASFLLDKEGRILAKDLSGRQLGLFLEELFE